MSNTLSKILALWLLLAPVFAQAQAVSLGIPNPAQQGAVVQGGGAVSGGPTVGYVLDQLSSYPAEALSVRQLTSSQYNPSYDWLVRRSSDNTQTQIGFAGGLLNTTALASFCSGTNAYLVTWKNAGSFGSSGDATQSTAANQPQVCASGVVTTKNGVPAIRFTSGTVSLLAPKFAAPSTNRSIIAGCKYFDVAKNGV
jgi:hypothetical protein